MTFLAIICFAAAAGLAIWLFLIWRGLSQDWLPDELKAGTLILVERNLLVSAPFPVIGRPDQVYRLKDKLYVPLENKNRNEHRVYETDIAQLSLQAWLLRRNGMPTAAFGYVAINSRRTGVRKALRVVLRDDAFCDTLIRRYLAITTSNAVPRKSRGAKCNSCGHRGYC